MQWWWNARRRLQRKSALGLCAVSNAFFDCILNEDYHANHYLYERRMHTTKRSLMQVVISQPERLRLLAALLEVTQLRTRVSDLSEFELCAIELRELRAALAACFQALARASGLRESLDWLSSAIAQFEGIVEHVLKVSARDPMVYALFLAALQNVRALLADGMEFA